jgi:hypothetical protein
MVSVDTFNNTRNLLLLMGLQRQVSLADRSLCNAGGQRFRPPSQIVSAACSFFANQH